MNRIRTIKPSFFKHEELFDAERETGLPLRIAFAGLWTCCDREGRFEWRPRTLKTDILPYDDVDFSRVLDALATRGFVRKYASGAREYGVVPGFKRHQVINNRESESTLPEPPQAIAYVEKSTRDPRVNHASATRHDLAQAEGKGREGKGREDSVANATAQDDFSQGDFEAEDPDAWRAEVAAQEQSQPVDLDPVRELFETGIRILSACGIAPAKARSLVGKWRKDYPKQDPAILAAICDFQKSGAVDPVPWITAKLTPKPHVPTIAEIMARI